MTDNGVQELEQDTPKLDNALQPPTERKTGSPQAAATAQRPAKPGSEDASDSLVRSVYAARSRAQESASAVDFSHMETAEESRLLRGAYLTHLAESAGETTSDPQYAGADVLRRAYVARIAAAPRPQSGRAQRARKVPAIKQPARLKAKRRAAPKARRAQRKRSS